MKIKSSKPETNLEWRTDCGDVEAVEGDDYVPGDWEPCVHCGSDACVARVHRAGDPAEASPVRTAPRPGEPSWARRIAALEWDLGWTGRRERILLHAVIPIADGAPSPKEIAKEALALYFACDQDRVAAVALQRKQDRQKRRRALLGTTLVRRGAGATVRKEGRS